MPFSKQQLKYHLTSFRTHKLYLIFQISQLILSIVIIIIALLSSHLFRQPLVLWLEFILLTCMSIDLFIIRLISESTLCQKKRNKVDLLIFFVFLFTFAFMWLTQAKAKIDGDSPYEELIEGDDIVIICIIVCRYMVQIYQIVNEIQQTQNNLACQQNIQNFDLNKAPYTSVLEENNDVMQDEIIRERIKSKKPQGPAKNLVNDEV